MGKVRVSNIKRVARLLLDRYGDKFTEDYALNKKLIDELLSISSKKVRNMLAGYVTSLVKTKARTGVVESSR